MKPKTTLVLLAIAIALGCYVKFYESKQPNTEEARRQASNVVNFKKEKIDGIVIQNGDDKIELHRQDGKWRIEAPVKDQADAAAISSLLNDIEDWRRETTFSAKEMDADKNRLAEYGVNKPKLRLKLLGPEAPPEIWFGKDAALEKQMYVRLENSRETFLASTNVRDDLNKKAEDFRDKKLTDITATQVTRAMLKNAAGEIELQKKGEHWELTKPMQARADDGKVGDLIAQITTTQIQQFLGDDHGDLAPYGLTEPRGAITVFTADAKQGQTLQIGAVSDKNKEQVFARFPARNAVYALPKKIEEVLNTKPADLRDRHLARIDTNILDHLHIQGAGKPEIVLARKDETWSMEAPVKRPANSAEVSRLVEFLKNEQVTKFVDDVASDLPKYGLDHPQKQVTFSSFASENTAETTAGEHPFLTIAFGRVEGDSVFARVTEEPFIVAVKATVLDAIWSDPIQWQELAIFHAKPDEVQALTVAKNGAEMSLARAGKEDWKWTKGEGPINKNNVQSLLNTLASLRAVRWVGATVPEQGLDQPQLAIAFSNSADGKASQRVLVGAAAGDGGWFARVEGRDGTFVISNPDYNALRLPLVEAPAPNATPPAAAPNTTPALSVAPLPGATP